MSTAELLLRKATENDVDALLSAHAAVFGAGSPERPARTLDGMRWRWLENPAPGGGLYAAFDTDGDVHAAIGGMPRRVRFAGKERSFLLLTDTFVVPGRRSGLQNPGPFLTVAKEFFGTCGGLSDDLSPVLYGLPTRAGHRVGKERLGIEVVRNQNRLVVRPDELSSATSNVTIEEVETFPEELDEFAERVCGGYEAIAVRDRAFLDWRFTGNPERDYCIALAREQGGRIVGYAVYGLGEFDGIEGALVADWLIDHDVPEAGMALRGWLRDLAREDNVPFIQALFPEFCADFVEFQAAGFRVEPTRLYLAARSWSRRQDMLWLYWNWYYTLADFDRS